MQDEHRACAFADDEVALPMAGFAAAFNGLGTIMDRRSILDGVARGSGATWTTAFVATRQITPALWAIRKSAKSGAIVQDSRIFASSERGNSDSAIEPHWKNVAPSAPLTDRRQPRRSRNAVLFAKSRTPSVRSVILCSMSPEDVIGDLLPSLVFLALSPVKGVLKARRPRRASPFDRARPLGRFPCTRSTARSVEPSNSLRAAWRR